LEAYFEKTKRGNHMAANCISYGEIEPHLPHGSFLVTDGSDKISSGFSVYTFTRFVAVSREVTA
jgi:hypothetical protein